MALIRKGQCNRCGQCCIGKTYSEPRIDCPNLEFKEGKAFCKIYEDRPESCRDFPTSAEELTGFSIPIKNCGFYFEK